MMPRFWALGQKVSSAKEALLLGIGISEEDFAEAVGDINGGPRSSECSRRVLREHIFTLWNA
jgi:hypothetical protein